VQILMDFIKNGIKPAEQVTLLTPVAITKDNLDVGERLSEAK
jgi:ribose transport system substrate-binding protein/inositol transport system substrate-binding protein